MITAEGYKLVSQVLAGKKQLTSEFKLIFADSPWIGTTIEGHEETAKVRHSNNKAIYYCTLSLEVVQEIYAIGLKYEDTVIAVEELDPKIDKNEDMNLPIDFILSFGRAQESVVVQSGINYLVENDTTLVEQKA